MVRRLLPFLIGFGALLGGCEPNLDIIGKWHGEPTAKTKTIDPNVLAGLRNQYACDLTLEESGKFSLTFTSGGTAGGNWTRQDGHTDLKLTSVNGKPPDEAFRSASTTVPFTYTTTQKPMVLMETKEGDSLTWIDDISGDVSLVFKRP